MNYENNIKILTDFEKALGNSQPVSLKIENPEGELIKVSKEEFAKWMEEGENIKTPPKESLVYGASGDIDSITYFLEIRNKDRFIRESYHQPRSEEEKKQIKKRQEKNQKRWKQEKSQNENSPIQDEKDHQLEKETSQQNQFQKLDNQENNNKNVYYGVGVIFLILAAISLWVGLVKKKRKLK